MKALTNILNKEYAAENRASVKATMKVVK